MYDTIKKFMQHQLATIAEYQRKTGVETVPKEQVEQVMAELARHREKGLRGLIMFAAYDKPNDDGVDVLIGAVGTPTMLRPLLAVGTAQVHESLDGNNRQQPGKPCDVCGDVHVNADHEQVDGLGEDFLDILTRRGPGAGARSRVDSPYDDLLVRQLANLFGGFPR